MYSRHLLPVRRDRLQPVIRTLSEPSVAGTDTKAWATAPRQPISATVIIPTHNLGEHLIKLLTQLEGTQLGGCEVIIVDDGSTDDTWSKISTWTGLQVPTLLKRFENNRGVAAVRNWAVNVARGAYIWLIDADDEWPSDALTTLLNAAERTHADIILGQAVRLIVSSGRETPVPAPRGGLLLSHSDLVRSFLKGDIQGHLWSKLFRRSLFNNETFPELRSKSDACGVAHLIRKASVGYTISSQIYRYRFHSGSIATQHPNCLDLLHVLESVHRTFGLEPTDELIFTIFQVRAFAIPVLCEIWRAGTEDPNTRLVERICTGLLTWNSTLSLLKAGERRLAIFSIAYRVCPHLLRRIYITSHQHEWQ